MPTRNVEQAAAMLFTHRNSICELIAQGAIPAAKVGRSYVMKTSDILAFLDAVVAHQTRREDVSSCEEANHSQYPEIVMWSSVTGGVAEQGHSEMGIPMTCSIETIGGIENHEHLQHQSSC